MSLALCPGCDRHVRGDTCPYCKTALAPLPAPLSGLSRMSRAALALGGVTAFSVGMVACYGGPVPPRPPSDAHDTDAPTTQVDAGTEDGGATTP